MINNPIALNSIFIWILKILYTCRTCVQILIIIISFPLPLTTWTNYFGMNKQSQNQPIIHSHYLFIHSYLYEMQRAINCGATRTWICTPKRNSQFITSSKTIVRARPRPRPHVIQERIITVILSWISVSRLAHLNFYLPRPLIRPKYERTIWLWFIHSSYSYHLKSFWR